MKRTLIVLMALAIGLTMTQFAAAQIITSVDRTNGVSGDRPPVGAHDGDTDPLPSDGVLYFSDREYPLVAPPPGEHVRTFNSDKNDDGDVNYAVTTGSVSYLQVFMDDRFSNGQELVDLVVSSFAGAGVFVDTGADLTLRENPDGSRDRALSIYQSSVVNPAGTYNFGYSTTGNNYYGIGAVVPEPMTLTLLGLGGLGLMRRRR